MHVPKLAETSSHLLQRVLFGLQYRYILQILPLKCLVAPLGPRFFEGGCQSHTYWVGHCTASTSDEVRITDPREKRNTQHLIIETCRGFSLVPGLFPSMNISVKQFLWVNHHFTTLIGNWYLTSSALHTRHLSDKNGGEISPCIFSASIDISILRRLLITTIKVPFT